MKRHLAAAAAAFAFSAGVLAQAYPAKPIRITVGFTAGGPADTMARVVAKKMAELGGQSVLVDNRAVHPCGQHVGAPEMGGAGDIAVRSREIVETGGGPHPVERGDVGLHGLRLIGRHQ